MPYFQDELLEFNGNNYCVRKKKFKDHEFRFVDSHFIYNYFDDSLLSQFVDCCESNQVDAVFLRLPPFCQIDNTPQSRIKKRTFTKNRTCFIDTSVDFFQGMSKSYRNLIRRAERLYSMDVIKPDANDLFVFAENYNEYMANKATADFYYLDPVKFQLLGGCPDLLLVDVKSESHDILVSALFIKYQDIFYYWFAYSIGNAPQGAGHLSIFAACKYALKERSLGVFLGGGITDRADDNLWKFKKRFSLEHISLNYVGLSISNVFENLSSNSGEKFLPW